MAGPKPDGGGIRSTPTTIETAVDSPRWIDTGSDVEADEDGEENKPRTLYWKLFGPQRRSSRRAAGLLRSAEMAPPPNTPSSSYDGSADDVSDDAKAVSSDNQKDEAGEAALLREQVALLMQTLEREKQRRAGEQHLMQSVRIGNRVSMCQLHVDLTSSNVEWQKIIELQGLIRRNMPEQQRALERRLQPRASPSAKSRLRPSRGVKHSTSGVSPAKSHCQVHVQLPGSALERSYSMPPRLDRFPSAENSGSQSNQSEPESQASPARADAKSAVEVRAKRQLTKLRARMHAAVAEAEKENAVLRGQLEREARVRGTRENQLRLEYQLKLAAVEDKHRRVVNRLALQAQQAEKLAEEKHQLAAMVHAQAECIRQLELAVAGKQIVDDATAR